MHDRFLKSKKTHTFNKSNTTVTLPGIHKHMNTSPFKNKKQTSSYLDTVAYISTNIDYDKEDKDYVIKEQNTLKAILKKINSDTMDLVHSIKPKRSPRMQSKQRQYETMDMEVQNSKKLLNILNYEVDQLKEKYKLIVEERQDVELSKKIDTIRQEIAELKQGNVGKQLYIFKEGKEIQQYLEDGGDSRLISTQTDHYMVKNRLDKLRSQSARVEQQNNRITTKLKELQPTIQQLQAQCQLIKNRNTEVATQKNKIYQTSSKKYQVQNLKKKIQFIKKSGQVRYYKLLRDLQTQTGCVTLIDNKTTQIESRTELAKGQIQKLEQLLAQARRRKKQQNQTVMEYLSTSRKLKVNEESRLLPEFHSEQEDDKKQKEIKSEEIVIQDPNVQEPQFEQLSQIKSPQQEKEKEMKIEENTPEVPTEQPQITSSPKVWKEEGPPIKETHQQKI